MKVKLIKKKFDGIEYQDLTLNNVYQVIGLEADEYRIINDEGQPYLYPPDIFTVVDPTEPDDWITAYGEDGERYAYPPELHHVGFFEDYFDDDPEAIAIFRQYLAKQRMLRSLTSKAA
jgi:hypothetical protein